MMTNAQKRIMAMLTEGSSRMMDAVLGGDPNKCFATECDVGDGRKLVFMLGPSEKLESLLKMTRPASDALELPFPEG